MDDLCELGDDRVGGGKKNSLPIAGNGRERCGGAGRKVDRCGTEAGNLPGRISKSSSTCNITPPTCPFPFSVNEYTR